MRIGYHSGMSLLLMLLTIAVGATSPPSATTIVLVRHAERQGTMTADPPLSPAGLARAQRLAALFGQTHGQGQIDAIYVTDTRRTQQTAAPLAADLGEHPVVTPAADVRGLAARVLREHRGQRVLIVGHSNTVPELVHALSGLTVPPIADEDYGNIYILTVPASGPATLLRLRY